jgi:hydroxymethylglutaryl-CoA synthase
LSKGEIGILGYGVYIPWQRIRTEAIVREREKGRKDLNEILDKVKHGLLLNMKSIAGMLEDSTTLATEAAENAIRMAGIDPRDINSVVVGTESKPYAVGTVARHVASFVGVGEEAFVGDVEGACNAGMQSLNFVFSQVKSGFAKCGLAIGSDVAQARMGDPLEYSAGAGAGAFVVGRGDPVAEIVDMAPYSSLTMDFWRRDGAKVPSHFGRTTVEAYIAHVAGAILNLFKRHPDVSISDFDKITFHQPSGYMPLKACRMMAQGQFGDRLKLSEEDIESKVKPWLRVLDTGNTYAASTPIALASILDGAKPGEDILAVSYGSGAYSIATWIRVGSSIEGKRGIVPKVEDYVRRMIEIKIETYKDVIREKLKAVKRKVEFPRIVGELEPLGDDFLEVAACDGCKRIYLPPRDKCLQYDCKGPLIKIRFPRSAKLKSHEALELRGRSRHNYEIVREGKAILVDCKPKDLRAGMELEAVIRRLYCQGKEGLIIYGPCYRPAFRSLFGARR